MAIKIKGKVVDTTKPTKEIKQAEESLVKLKSTSKTLIHKKVIEQSHNEPLLVVNGKVKKINKDSMYLIDMLITDEE